MTDWPGWVWINGEFKSSREPVISAFDRGLMLADGIYETLLGLNGEPLFFDDHWQRLSHSAKALRIPLPVTATELAGFFREIMDRNSLSPGRSRLKAVLTRGPNTQPAWELECDNPTLLITAWPAPAPREKPIALATIPWRRDAAETIWQHKTLSLLSRGLTRAELNGRGYDDGLILNTRDHVCEATTSNIFATIDGRIITPPVSEGLLPGTVRAQILRALREGSDWYAVEEVLTRDHLLQADAVWICNAISPVLPVCQIDEHTLEVSDRGRRAMEAVRNLVCV